MPLVASDDWLWDLIEALAGDEGNVFADCGLKAGHGWVGDADAVGQRAAEGKGEVSESEMGAECRIENEGRREERYEGEREGCEELHSYFFALDSGIKRRR